MRFQLKYKNSKLIVLVSLLFSILSCDKTPSNPPLSKVPSDTTAHGMFICNEGNFQWGNASLSFYNTSNFTLQEDIFKSSNQKGLGDVLQSMSIVGEDAYLVVNNSQKIEIINAKTFKSTATISGFNSPRYLLSIGSGKAYVSDLYEKAIWIVNLQTKQIIGKVVIPSWTEEMVYRNNKVYVCGRTSNYVYVIKTMNDQLIDSINIGYGAQNMVLDQTEKIWVLTVGKDAIAAQLHCIGTSGNLINSFNFSKGSTPNKLICNPNKTKIYWINKDIYSMNIDANQLPTTPIISADGKNFYAIGYNPNQNEIMASDAKDYVQKSEIYRYDTVGNLKGNFKAGINATYFYSK
jgi:DNA-binding beta-propeller fold protein YncE